MVNGGDAGVSAVNIPSPEVLAQRLKEIRSRRLMRELSRRSGVGYSYLSKLVRGEAPVEAVSPGNRLILVATADELLRSTTEGTHDGKAAG